jgi:hypothetical protein
MVRARKPWYRVRLLLGLGRGRPGQSFQSSNETHWIERYPLQSGVRPIQWTDGADHEGLATLLRADGDPVGLGSWWLPTRVIAATILSA